MAAITVQFTSAVLERSVPLRVFIPLETQKEVEQKLPTLYLLHGLTGSENDWFQYTRVALWARELGLAVVCPSGENSFYVPQDATGLDYLRFLTDELPAFTRRLFPLSDRREDTFIGGLSMGGYGALLAGLTHGETFSKVVALSSALEPWARMDGEQPKAVKQPRYAKALFGETPEKWNPLLYADASMAPAIWMGCGTSDPLLPLNRAFVQEANEKGLSVHYEETEGSHSWLYWDREIERGMRWLMA